MLPTQGNNCSKCQTLVFSMQLHVLVNSVSHYTLWYFCLIIFESVEEREQKYRHSQKNAQSYLQDISNSSIRQKHGHHGHPTWSRTPSMYHWLQGMQLFNIRLNDYKCHLKSVAHYHTSLVCNIQLKALAYVFKIEKYCTCGPRVEKRR